jgi:hypothetical protein
MREVIPNAPAAGNKARPGLSKEESARFFGPPPLIAGEDQAQYEAMRDRISAAVGPLDFLEEIWVMAVGPVRWPEGRNRVGVTQASRRGDCGRRSRRRRLDHGRGDGADARSENR